MTVVIQVTVLTLVTEVTAGTDRMQETTGQKVSCVTSGHFLYLWDWLKEKICEDILPNPVSVARAVLQTPLLIIH